MPRAFLIKKHHSTSIISKRRFKYVDDDDDHGFHLAAEAKDYSKTSLASNSGSETCSTPSNSPSPPSPYGFLKDDIGVHVNATAAAAEWVARSTSTSTSLDDVGVYSRANVLEPVNNNAAWIHARPLFDPTSYLPFAYYSTFRHHHHHQQQQQQNVHPTLYSSNDIGYLYGYTNSPNEKSSSIDNAIIKDDVIPNNVQQAVTAASTAISNQKKTSSSSSDVDDTITMKSIKPVNSERGARRYNCPDCNKSYSTHSGLSKHQQFHCATNNKRSFCCKYCDKQYVSLGALKMHIRTHTLPCKCKLCGKAFSRPWLLQGHIRTHTGEKPFSCPHCNRAFADRSNLRAHLQTHSDIKKYSCKSCAKTFSRMSLLLKHEDGGCDRSVALLPVGASLDSRLGP